jgi:putative tRNA adenosine deaminase-associated protein
VAYFTAVLSPEGSGDDRDWRSVDIDLEAGSPDELGDVLRGAVDDDDASVLAVLEREDEWFALVRTDGGVDTKVFVSDAVAAADSSYAPLFAELPPATGAFAGPLGDDDGSDDGSDDTDDEGEQDDEPTTGRPEPAVAEDVWAGDPELLADLGLPAEVLVRIAGSGADPSGATVEIGELLGFADVLESLR